MVADETEEARFAFGQNWRDFSRGIDAERLVAAREGIERLVGVGDLSGRSFLDVGSGSGLMALAAHEMGAQVTAFDYDHDSVDTTAALRDAGPGPDAYRVLQGSALDEDFLAGLGQFDVVYSWGVLHHTGDLWRACDLVAPLVAPNGLLALAIYNDQGLASRVWKRVKQTYVEGGPATRQALVTVCDVGFRARSAAASGFGTRGRSASSAGGHTRVRGMDRRHDLVDWVGGYPFEVAKPEEVFEFFKRRGFQLERLSTCAGGLGCNELLFRRST